MIREIKVNSFKVKEYKAPLDIDPYKTYKIGKYLEISFEITSMTGFRIKSDFQGKYSYKIPKDTRKPICKMSYDELEEMAYTVLKKEFDKTI